MIAVMTIRSGMTLIAFISARRIIPFVAADALVSDKGAPSTVTGYPTGAVGVAPELRRTEANFYDVVTQENRFSPPRKTEGTLS